MRGRQTRRWWVTRVELGIGIILVVLGLALLFAVILPGMFEPTFDSRAPGQLQAAMLWLAVAVLGLVGGLVWMIRIFRGPRDEAPAWRYRAR
jgi:hypothetical protein